MPLAIDDGRGALYILTGVGQAFANAGTESRG